MCNNIRSCISLKQSFKFPYIITLCDCIKKLIYIYIYIPVLETAHEEDAVRGSMEEAQPEAQLTEDQAEDQGSQAWVYSEIVVVVVVGWYPWQTAASKYRVSTTPHKNYTAGVLEGIAMATYNVLLYMATIDICVHP